ncbi:hypothetical protein Taro_046485 [Colocasia esculenta]|uniref:DUF7036 domain-containing protein n=1 Tax=Colocasia esculenta TaxID=4460 RepID=A0A843WSJ8_COLES|nr:hypothetical protein [Colocasia esculenta]
MGKPTEEEQVGIDPEAGAGDSGLICCHCSGVLERIGGAFSLRCVLVLLLSVCMFLSAVFWLPPFRALGSGHGAEGADNIPASIQASFILQKSISSVAAYTGQLEYDIYNEIGVPNTKVSIIATHPISASNSTFVIFGVLPESKYAVISPVALSILRSSLIELVLQQSNLSLTPSIFGQPSSFEVLKFPGGITVIPDQSVPIWQMTQILFNFTLNNSIIQVQKNLEELKGQLKFGLNLKSYENVYVQMTNLNGSTVAPPVIVEASVLSDVGSRILLPPRLKQLAQTITRTPAKNLGLDHTVFGRVKEVRLSSYLNNSITSIGSPSPSPSPSYEPHHSGTPLVSPYPVPSPTNAPPPSTESNPPSPLGSPSLAPVQDLPRPRSPQFSISPSPSPTTAPVPRRSPCLLPPPDASPVVQSHPPLSHNVPHAPAPSLQKPLAPATKVAPSPHNPTRLPPEISPALPPLLPPSAYGRSPQYDKGSGRKSNSQMLVSPNSPSPSRAPHTQVAVEPCNMYHDVCFLRQGSRTWTFLLYCICYILTIDCTSEVGGLLLGRNSSHMHRDLAIGVGGDCDTTSHMLMLLNVDANQREINSLGASFDSEAPECGNKWRVKVAKAAGLSMYPDMVLLEGLESCKFMYLECNLFCKERMTFSDDRLAQWPGEGDTREGAK